MDKGQVKGKIELGRLEKVDFHDVWSEEATEFTPWLAKEENLKFLGDTIGSQLELEAQESEIGDIRADILCKDAATDHWVLICNQLERTDNSKLGELLSCASGLEAVTVIWIALSFGEEQRATIEWLNEITNGKFNFFGLEVEFWRIGDSHVAPRFSVISGPEEWTHSTIIETQAESGEDMSETKMIYQRFWVAFKEHTVAQQSIVKLTKPLPQNWINATIGRGGFHLAAVASFWDSVAESFDSHEIRVELTIDDKDSHIYFSMLEASKDEIEEQIGESLNWYNLPDERKCRIYVRKSTNLKNGQDWSKDHAWLLEKLESFHHTFSNRVRKLKLPSKSE
jgi:hypothetical protein